MCNQTGLNAAALGADNLVYEGAEIIFDIVPGGCFSITSPANRGRPRDPAGIPSQGGKGRGPSSNKFGLFLGLWPSRSDGAGRAGEGGAQTPQTKLPPG